MFAQKTQSQVVESSGLDTPTPVIDSVTGQAVRNSTEPPNSIPERHDLELTAAPLLRDSNVLGQLADVIKVRGFAGDPTPVLLAYIAITSRLLQKPMNLAFVAPSSTGKSRAVEAAMGLVPPQAVYLVHAASPRALVYSDEDFKHRVVVMGEADSISDEGSAASAIRSIVSESRLVYEVVEKGTSGTHRTRRIEKEGLTGLITTSTRSLAHQMGTRVLEVALNDDPEQTREVMRAQARLAAGELPAIVDVAPFIAFQDWLQRFGSCQAVVPFAPTLAELLPPDDVRMRRDFAQLLTAIQTLAILRQRHRVAQDGYVLADLADYEDARKLLSPTFKAAAEQGLTAAVRQTVECISAGETDISLKEVQDRIGLKGKSSARVQKAIEGGWLIDDEYRAGYPLRLRRGASMPDHATALPSQEDLAERFVGSGGSRVLERQVEDRTGLAETRSEAEQSEKSERGPYRRVSLADGSEHRRSEAADRAGRPRKRVGDKGSREVQD